MPAGQMWSQRTNAPSCGFPSWDHLANPAVPVLPPSLPQIVQTFPPSLPATKRADLYMAVLLQQVVPAQYAFVLHTADPLTGKRAPSLLRTPAALLSHPACISSSCFATSPRPAAALRFHASRAPAAARAAQASGVSCTASLWWAWARRW